MEVGLGASSGNHGKDGMISILGGLAFGRGDIVLGVVSVLQSLWEVHRGMTLGGVFFNQLSPRPTIDLSFEGRHSDRLGLLVSCGGSACVMGTEHGNLQVTELLFTYTRKCPVGCEGAITIEAATLQSADGGQPACGPW